MGKLQQDYLDKQPPFPGDETGIDLPAIRKAALAGPEAQKAANLHFGIDPEYTTAYGAAEGGRIGYAKGSKKGYADYVQAMNALGETPMPIGIYNSLSGIMSDQELVNMGSPGKAQGGRIGYRLGTPHADPRPRGLGGLKDLDLSENEIWKKIKIEELRRKHERERERYERERMEMSPEDLLDMKRQLWENLPSFEDIRENIPREFLQRDLLRSQGGRVAAQEGGLMNLGGMEKDYRQEGGFVPIGGQEKADDVPARLSKNEFVFTADAVRAAGGGDVDAGAEVMENVMENLEAGGKVSEESQGLEGARNMFANAQRLEKRII